jgi:hypothetical protein
MIAKAGQDNLDKDKILTCESKHSIFNSLMKGLDLLEAAKIAGVSYDYSRRLVTKGHIRALVRQEKAKIEAKTAEKLQITRESLTKNYMKAYDLAEDQGSSTGMTQATQGIARLYGLDKQVIEQSEQQRQLSEVQASEARRLAEIRLREDMSSNAEKVPQKAAQEPEYAVDWTNDSQDKDNTGSDGRDRPKPSGQEQDDRSSLER